ncbi:MAG: S41 family peptidase [Bacteroidetes bacterium SW_9_63_38]|nr:MAG: S41 family peptidase [Bacteroidetes bacterium SW_9_63_38]
MIPKRIKASFLAVLLGVSVMLGVAVGAWMPADDDIFALQKNVRIFGAVYEELVTGYVEPVDPKSLMRVGIEAMLSELDPYTTFLDEADHASIEVITKGQYGGVGLTVDQRQGELTVVAPVEGASGEQQGIRAGDVITHASGQAVAPLSMDDVRTLLRGEPGTTVPVTVRREGASSPLHFTLTREEIELNNVTYRGRVGDDAEVGYVKMERFTRGAAGELETALRALRDGDELSGLILDLRDNPGGLLNAAVEVSELFVPEGAAVVTTEGRLPQSDNTYRSDRAPLLPTLPLAVLVNGRSASASEIVAGAVQDHDRGVVLGTTTYGKGLVQAIRSLPHNTSLKMTTAQYHTPSGRSIQEVDAAPVQDTADTASTGRRPDTTTHETHKTAHGRTVRDGNGLRPDVRIEAPTSGALEQALEERSAFFYYANHYAASRDSLPPDFAVTDAMLHDFRAWLEVEDIRYRTEAETAVRRLKQRLSEATYAEVKDEVTVLQEAVQAEEDDAFSARAPALKRHLEREIRARFMTASARMAALLPTDRQVGAAVTLLHAPDRYDEILSPEE